MSMPNPYRAPEGAPQNLDVVLPRSRFARNGSGLFDRLTAWLPTRGQHRLNFTRNLATMLQAGLHLDRALLGQIAQQRNRAFKAVLQGVRQQLLDGRSLSEALACYPQIFNEVYCTVVEAGERSGKLEECLERLGYLLHRAEQIEKRVMLALVYPGFLVFSACIVATIMFNIVVPMLTHYMQSLNVPVEGPLLWLMHASAWWWLLPLVLILVVAVCVAFFKTPFGDEIGDELVLYLPVAGNLSCQIQNAHFLSTVQVAFAAGLPITEAARLAARTLSNRSIQEAYVLVEEPLRQGQSLTAVLTEIGLMPETTLDLLAAGEEAGNMEHALQTAGAQLEEQINHHINMLLVLLQPVAVLLMLVTIGGILAVFYTAIFGGLSSMFSNLGQIGQIGGG